MTESSDTPAAPTQGGDGLRSRDELFFKCGFITGISYAAQATPREGRDWRETAWALTREPLSPACLTATEATDLWEVLNRIDRRRVATKHA